MSPLYTQVKGCTEYLLPSPIQRELTHLFLTAFFFVDGSSTPARLQFVSFDYVKHDQTGLREPDLSSRGFYEILTPRRFCEQTGLV